MAGNKWDIERIKRCIDFASTRLDEYWGYASSREAMYDLCLYSPEEEVDANEKGITLKVSSMPKSIIVTSDKMINYHPQITVPCYKAEEEEDSRSRSRFLSHVWDQQHHIQLENPLKIMSKTAAVLGRAAGKIVWMGNDSAFPIKMWALRPEDVYVKYGHKGKHWALHRFEMMVGDARDMYGVDDAFSEKKEHDTITVTDFWYATYSKSGKATVYNAVVGCPILGDDEFLKSPKRETHYTAIPIFMAYADHGIGKHEGKKGTGLLEGLDNAWETESQVDSLYATSGPAHYFPVVFVRSEHGMSKEFKLDLSPGAVNELTDGEEVFTLNLDPNRALADAMSSRAQDEISRLTFTPQLFGINPNGQPNAAFGISQLMQTTYGRMNGVITCVEHMCQHMNEMALCFAEKFFPPEGREFWLDEPIDGYKDASITPSQISSTYQNTVRISITLDGTDVSQRTLSLNEYREGLLSDNTYWERHKASGFSEDERTKIQMMAFHRDPDTIRNIIQEVMARKGKTIPLYEPNSQNDGQIIQDAINQVMQQQIAASAQQQVAPIDPALSGPLQGQLQPAEFGMPQQGQAGEFQNVVQNQEISLAELQEIEAGLGANR